MTNSLAYFPSAYVAREKKKILGTNGLAYFRCEEKSFIGLSPAHIFFCSQHISEQKKLKKKKWRRYKSVLRLYFKLCATLL